MCPVVAISIVRAPAGRDVPCSARVLAPPEIACQPSAMRWISIAWLLVSVCCARAERWTLVKPMVYSGMADASGAVAVSSNLFVVADDERNVLCLYSSEHGGPPLKEFDCDAFLEVTGKSREVDLEAGTLLGDRAFWIGSHGRNKNGKERSNRCRFFATDIKLSAGEVFLTPVGRPYKSLLDDLVREPALVRFHLADAAALAPKERGALNIEGLSATPDGHLLIGFRNPIPQDKALVVPLLNPNEVVEGAAARLGAPLQLDLDGLGIRDIALYQGEYLIIAGSFGEGGRFELYRWRGGQTTPKRVKVDHFNRYHSEAIIIYPQLGLHDVQILSDDGSEKIAGVPAHEVTDWSKRTFRSFRVTDFKL